SHVTTHVLFSMCLFVLFYGSVTPKIYTLSLHDALPISRRFLSGDNCFSLLFVWIWDCHFQSDSSASDYAGKIPFAGRRFHRAVRSEEHTSELQSRFDLVCRLLLENKKKYE